MTGLQKVVLADLRRSGLDAQDVEKLRIECLEYDPEPAKAFGSGIKLRAYKLPYFDLAGKLTRFYRVRLLDEWKPKGAKKPRKYTQPPGTAPELYLPPYLDWKKIARDPAVEIVITEGEKKAAAACKLGITCFALGGVWSWLTSESAAVPSDPIDALSLFEWRRRKAFLAFDSDIRFKPSVQSALKALNKHLIDRGANPYDVAMPSRLGGRSQVVGVDDFLVYHRKRALAAWNALPRRSLFVPDGLTASQLLALDLPLPTFVIGGLIPIGLTVLAGPPKLGKSRLMRQLALAKAVGTKALGTYDAAPGAEVLLLALEDTQGRIKAHLNQLAAHGVAVNTDRLHVRIEWPTVENGGLEALERFLEEHPACKLVIVDTLARLRARPTGSGQLYYEDYDAIAALKRIADAHRIAIVVVHHTRKAGDADIYNTISGSTGLSGSADTNMVLARGRGEVDAELHITGRDVEEQALALRFDGGVWTYIGTATEHRKSEARKAIVGALAALGHPAPPKEIAGLVEKNREAVKRTMVNMASAGDLRPVGDGTYALPAWPIEKGEDHADK